MEATRRITIGNNSYEISSDDEYLTHLPDPFEPHMVELYRLLMPRKGVALDIGANIGCVSLLMGEMGHDVLAFEPSPSTFGFLKKNVDRAGFGNVSLHNCGLGSEDSSHFLTFAPSNRSGGYVDDAPTELDGHVTEEIHIKVLDNLFDRDQLDFVKMDVEGYEPHVLAGAGETLQQFRPNVVMELNHFCLNVLQRITVPDFLDRLAEIFPFVFAVDQRNYLDLSNPHQRYTAMYYHVVHNRFPNIVAGFDKERLHPFLTTYTAGFDASVALAPAAPPPPPRIRTQIADELKRRLHNITAR